MKQLLRALLPVMVIGSTVTVGAVAPVVTKVVSAQAVCQFGAYAQTSGWFGNCTQSTALPNEEIRVEFVCQTTAGGYAYINGPWVKAKGPMQPDGMFPRSAASCPNDGQNWIRSGAIAGRSRYL